MKAFPNLVHPDYQREKEDGMNLRDYFAAKAMQALVANFANDRQGWGMSHFEIAIEAYNQADAMMEVRDE